MANEIDFDLKLGHESTKKLVESCVKANMPIMIHGAPGIGKSDLVATIAKEQGRELIDIRLPLYESVDIKGYPYLEENEETGLKRMQFAISNTFPTDPESKAILFFDEVNGALPTTMIAMYQLFLGRRIGDYKLPDGVSMIAAGNREEDSACVFSMPKPLENRMAHVELVSNFDSWLDWAVDAGIHSDIIGFLLKNKSKLMEFNPEEDSAKANSRAFATPRSWAMTSNLIKLNPDDDEMVRHQVSSLVGEDVAASFMVMRKTINLLPDANDILQGKDPKLKKDLEQALYHLLIINVLQTLKETLVENKVENNGRIFGNKEWNQSVNSFFDYILKHDDKILPEFAAMIINAAYAADLPFSVSESPNMSKYIKHHYKVLKSIPTFN